MSTPVRINEAAWGGRSDVPLIASVPQPANARSASAIASDHVRAQQELPRLYVAALVPPPVTGMTLVTEKVVPQLQSAGPVTFWNWSPGEQPTHLRMRTMRVLRTTGCIGKLIMNGPVAGNRLYLLANARSGLLFTALLAAAARVLGYRVYVHHHTYGYIDHYSLAMAFINRCVGERGAHIVHCDQMIGDFRRQYSTKSQFLTLFPSVVTLDVRPQRTSAGKPFRLGMFSNLTLDKGVDLAIETFKSLRKRGRLVCLKLAGPIRSRAAKRSIDQALTEHPDSVFYVGSVYGEAKAQFFDGIDALVFPTRYRNESWGIVLNEAFAAGVPVITYDRGCSRTVVGDRGGGLVVPRDGNYVAAAVPQIERWMDDADQYRAASQAAVEQALYLNQQAQIQLQQLVAHMFSPLARHSAATSVTHKG